MWYPLCLMPFYFNLSYRPNSTHKHESKMLIEHNNRSTEDKPIIQIRIYNSSCPTKIESNVRYDSQQDAPASKVFLNIKSANLPNVTHTPQRQLQKSTQVNKRIPHPDFRHHLYFQHPFAASIFTASSIFTRGRERSLFQAVQTNQIMRNVLMR